MRLQLINTAIAIALIVLAPGQRAIAQAPPASTQNAATTVTTGNAEFGFRLLAKLVTAKPHDKILISPLSLGDALALAYNGAKGRTASEMRDVLGLGGLTLVQADNGFAQLNGSVSGADPKTEIDIANALWARAGAGRFAPDYLDRCRRYLDAIPQTLDFLSPAAASAINQWVSDHTKGHITRIVEPAMLRRSQAVLTNAVYFHGTWASPFNPRRTRDEPFYKDDGSSVSVAMMSIEGRFQYASTDGVQVVELPYGNGRLSMVVVLPSAGTSLSDVVGKMTASQWQEMLGSLKSTRVALSMPRYTMDYKDAGLAETLGALGMPTAVSAYADFSGTGIPGLYIGAVVHEATMDVDEAGTVASAATGIMMMPLAVIASPSTVMTVDHPFLCAICDSATGTVLFAGVVRVPR
jgi:serine protease inhibitor